MKLKENRLIKYLILFYKGYYQYRVQFVVLIILGLFTSIFESIGIGAAIPLFTFITGGPQVYSNFIIDYIKYFFAFLHLNFSIKNLLIFICLLFIIRAFFMLLCIYVRIRIEATYSQDVRTRLFRNTLNSNWGYLIGQKLGHLETALMTNVSNTSFLLQKLSLAIMSITGLIVYSFFAIRISPIITVITIILGVLMIYFFKPFFYRVKKLGYETEKTNRQISHLVNENIVGLKTLKILHVEKNIASQADDFFSNLKKLYVKSNFLKNVTDAFIQPVALIFVCIILAISFKMPDFSMAALIAVIYLIQRMFVYFQQLQVNLHAISDTTPYLQVILEFEDQVKKHKENNFGRLDFEFKRQLEFRNISFSYNQDNEILDSINFKINKGEFVGLIGGSGSGKTTIVDILLRLFEPQGGEILLDGINIKDIDLVDWRRNIGYVSQDIFLKNDSIKNNITFYDESLLMEAIIEAAKMANIYDFIDSLPDKFDTVIGERGLLLSVGQRQRIIIARALIRQPQILVLDEATSSLDNESEKQIQAVMEKLKNKTTIIAIAHRLSTVLNSDKIIVLENGNIIENGEPRALLADNKSYFYKLYNIK